MVTKECFISVCWRLIPYFLNNWEKQWGAECSSMMFELPHFAIELLVVLPTVQVKVSLRISPVLVWQIFCSLTYAAQLCKRSERLLPLIRFLEAVLMFADFEIADCKAWDGQASSLDVST